MHYLQQNTPNIITTIKIRKKKLKNTPANNTRKEQPLLLQLLKAKCNNNAHKCYNCDLYYVIINNDNQTPTSNRIFCVPYLLYQSKRHLVWVLALSSKKENKSENRNKFCVIETLSFEIFQWHLSVKREKDEKK